MRTYKLGVWKSNTRISDQDAAGCYLKLSDGSLTSKFAPEVHAFYSRLTARHPEVEMVDEDELDSCPWACAIELSDGHVLLEIMPDKVGSVAQLILSLADEHGLVCFDPQGATVYLPLCLKAAADLSVSTPKRPKAA